MAIPNKYVLGQVVVVTDTITNPITTALTDDNSDVLTVYKPDLTTASPAVNHLSLGIYNAQITVDQAGWWEYRFASTGATTGAGRGKFWVQPVP